MKTYKLIGKNNHPDISFTVEDLIPVRHKKLYEYMELVRLIDYSHYDFSNESFEYAALYEKAENQNIDFFKIRGTDVIVIPGNHVYPTLLKDKDIV
jgi:hypothetical protein